MSLNQALSPVPFTSSGTKASAVRYEAEIFAAFAQNPQQLR